MNDFVIKKAKTEKVNFSVSIDRELQERLDQIASETRHSRNYIINELLSQAVNRVKLEE